MSLYRHVGTDPESAPGAVPTSAVAKLVVAFNYMVMRPGIGCRGYPISPGLDARRGRGAVARRTTSPLQMAGRDQQHRRAARRQRRDCTRPLRQAKRDHAQREF